MRIGATSFRLTGLLASSRRRRQLRSDLRVSRQVIAAEVTYVIKIPETGAYLRLPELEWKVLTMFDGRRTDQEVWEGLAETEPDLELSPEELADFADSSDPGLWEKTLAEKNLALLEKIRGERRERAGEQNIFYMYFSAWDPTRFFDAVLPYLRWIWTPGFFLFTMGLLAAGLLVFATDLDRIVNDALQFYNFYNKSWGEFIDLWILLLIVGFLHECAHGMTCRNFGGEVHQMGFLLMYFTPAFYTDVSDIYLFDKDYKRLWTIFAGIWAEITLCVIALIVWSFTLPGSWLYEWSYKFALMTSITGILLNLNPLLKFDGYYALSQILRIDNLREDSFDYVKAWLKKYVLRREVVLPAVSRRRRPLFLFFGTAAFVYSTLVLILVLGLVKNIFTRKFGEWGYALTVLVIYLILRGRLKRVLPGAWNSLRKRKDRFMAWKTMRTYQAGALALALTFLFLPFPSRISSEFTLEAGERAEVRASVPGLVIEVPVREGETVARDSVVAVLRNADVDEQAAFLRTQLELNRRSLMASEAKGDLTMTGKYTQEVARLEKEVGETERERQALVLRSPISGTVATPHPDQRLGEYLDKGAAMAVVVDRQVVRARILVRDWQLEDVAVGAPVKLKVQAYPLRTFAGKVRQIMPAAAAERPVAEPKKLERSGQELSNYFAVALEFPNPEGVLREGMTGQAKVSGPSSSLAWQAGRAFWRWVRFELY